ncbi:type VI secretion system baseplate subunit TssG [Azoarcus indigens]|uniref:Type VI secretion system protein ImpH n=1 Tax=Azoarcus indigens TaxID=29545 RepID=A0A4R6DQL4_9RHOO|nr:type VI secretion system baseplate subunit TssG [Azoarcus indigens]NMG67100.1 type VI secretion system baseplate subunit TssG [Azoarcus indigens]TDN47267.1 type VI secretion system protein ImpH [Azoarcus indigens]
MAHADRQTAPDLADTLLAEACSSNFFSLLERLHRLHDDDLEAQDRLRPGRQRVRLSSYAGLGFPAADVSLATRLPPPSASDYLVQATFLGLHGPDSPLPGYYLDRLAYEAGQGIGIRPAFLDVFHHRLLIQLHQAWRKYRYYMRFRQGARDHFSRYVFALIGLGDARLRGETPIAWSRLLSFAGMVAGRSRSSGMVAGIIAHCFDLQAVHIRQFELRHTAVPDDQRNALGRRNCTLARDFVLGRRVRTRHSKFTICIPALSRQRFRDFLPSGAEFPRLRKLIDFLLRDPHAYDIELGLRVDEVPPFNIARDGSSHLGWTSFLRQAPGQRPPTVRVKVRQ